MKGCLFPAEIKRKERRKESDRRVTRKRKKRFLHLDHHAEKRAFQKLNFTELFCLTAKISRVEHV